MEQLNYRFLNYKKYNTFAKDLADEKIREDAIVFVQDRPCIWARGKEYVCDGPNTADIQSGTFTFKNGKDKVIFSASQEDGVITLTDGNGNSIAQEYVLKDWYDGLQTNLRTKFKSVDKSIEDIKEDIRNIGTDKQDKLIPGENISITNNKNGKPIISAIVDTSLYIMVSSLDDVTYPNPNKIYLLETTDQNGDTIHEQYKWSQENQEWIHIGTATPKVDMGKYLEQEYAYLAQNYQPKGEYAGKQWVLDTFVKQSSVYTPTDGGAIGGGSSSEGEGSSGVVIPSGNSNITVDKTLSTLSANPVENRTITIALQDKVDNSALQQYVKKSELTGKVDSTELENYVTNIQHIQDLATKQNVLTPGSGISIENDEISVDVDTNPILIVSELPSNPNPNKIYLLETVQDGETVYIENRYDEVNEQWVEFGRKEITIDLTPYATKSEVSSTLNDYLTKVEAAQNYQTIINDYATKDELEEVDQKFDDCATSNDLAAALQYVGNEYQKRGNYVFAGQVSTALNVLQRVIDQKYVLKKDVYRSNESGWSSSEVTPISVEGTEGSTSGAGSNSNMVTLTTQEYQELVDKGLVNEETYYFTYEGEVETNWTFGGTFPVILSGGIGIGEFPITLT